MNKLCIAFLSLSFCCIEIVSAQNAVTDFNTCFQEPQECALPCDSTSRLKAVRGEFGATFGDYIGIRQGYTEVGLLGIVQTPSDSYVLLEGRGFLLAHNDYAASIGIGVRKPFCWSSPIILGANIYYDYRTAHSSQDADCDCCIASSSRRSYGSVGLGLEMLSECFDIRSNIYLPVKENHSTTSFFSYPGGYFGSVKTTKYIPYGIDAEVSKGRNLFSNFYATGAIGAYAYFFKHSQNIYGPFARLELDWGDYVSLQARYSYDRHYHSSVQGRVLFSLPFEQLASCFDACSAICFDPLTQPVRRNYIPFTQKKCCWNGNW